MIAIHEVFICKPGYASKLAKKLKEAMSEVPEFTQILTDVTGQFNRVIMISQYENLASYEKNMEKYKMQSEEIAKMLEAMAGYQEMYLTGSREIYQVW